MAGQFVLADWSHQRSHTFARNHLHLTQYVTLPITANLLMANVVFTFQPPVPNGSRPISVSGREPRSCR